MNARLRARALSVMLAATAATCMPHSSWGNCLAEGDAALATGDYAEAARAYAATRGMQGCDEIARQLNEAYARQRLVELGHLEEACRAAALYTDIEAAAADDETQAVAAAQAMSLQAACTPAPPPSTEQDVPANVSATEARGATMSQAPNWLWVAAGAMAVAGGVIYGFAVDADQDRAKARRQYTTAIANGDAAGWQDAASRFEDARDRTNTLGISAITLVGAGVVTALVGLAIEFEDNRRDLALHAVPGGFWLQAAW